MDDTFKIELSLLDALSGQAAELRMTSRLLTILPTKEREVPIKRAVAAVEVICNDPSTKLAPHQVQSASKIVLASLRCIESGAPLDITPSATSKMLRAILTRMANFFRAVPSGGEATGSAYPKELVAGDAMKYTIKLCMAEYKAKKLTAAKVKQTRIYRRLVEATQEDDAVTLIAAVQEIGGKAAAVAASKSKSKSKSKRVDDANAEALNMLHS